MFDLRLFAVVLLSSNVSARTVRGLNLYQFLPTNFCGKFGACYLIDLDNPSAERAIDATKVTIYNGSSVKGYSVRCDFTGITNVVKFFDGDNEISIQSALPLYMNGQIMENGVATPQASANLSQCGVKKISVQSLLPLDQVMRLCSTTAFTLDYPCPAPSVSPSNKPSVSPTTAPSRAPTMTPTNNPTKAPTNNPTKAPTLSPTSAPVMQCSISSTAKNLISNGSFETNWVPAQGYRMISPFYVSGWKSLHGTSIELWGPGFKGVPAVQGANILELDATNGSKLDYLYQDIWTVKNQKYEASFFMQARVGANFLSEDETAVFSWNGKESSHTAAKAGVWTKITVIVTGTGGMDRFALRESSAAGANSSHGPLIDDVRLLAVSCK